MTKVMNYYQARSGAAKQTKRLSLKLVNISLMTLIIALGVFHLMNVSDLTVKGFVLKELKTQVSILASEQLGYEEKINNLQSYYTLNSRAENLAMVAISEIDYLTVPAVVVARK